MSKVLILVDHVGGVVTPAIGELATFGKRIGDVTAVICSSKSAELIPQLSTFAISTVIVCDGVEFEKFSVGATAQALSAVVAKENPAAVLISSTARGKEIAGRLAVRINSGLITDAIDIDASCVATQSVFGDQQLCTQLFRTGLLL